MAEQIHPNIITVTASLHLANWEGTDNMWSTTAPPTRISLHETETLLTLWQSLKKETDARIQWNQNDRPATFHVFDSDMRLVESTHSHYRLNRNGELQMGGRWEEITLLDLRLLHEAGVYANAPHHIGFADLPAVGNGFLLDWDTLTTMLSNVEKALTLVGLVTSAQAVKTWGSNIVGFSFDSMMGRANRAIELIEQHRDRWDTAGVFPDDLSALLAISTTSPQSLARLLGLNDPKDAEMLQHLFSPGIESEEMARVGRAILKHYHAPIEQMDARLALHLLQEYLSIPVASGSTVHVRLARCACPKNCDCFAQVAVIPQGLKLGFTRSTDHFVLDDSLLENASARLDEDRRLTRWKDSFLPFDL